MTKKPLVTVIIPAYRNPDYLRSAITSVLEQTYQKFEIIVVNDNPENVNLFNGVVASIGDERIRIYHHKVNQHTAQARNTGMKHAKGEIFAYLDDDDFFLPDYLKKNVEIHVAQPEVGLVYCGYIRKWAEGPLKSLEFPAKVAPIDVAKAMMRGDFTLHCGSIATVKASCFQTVKGFDIDLYTFEDWDMWLRVAQTFKITHINDPLVIYSHHLTGRSSSSLDRRLMGLHAAQKKYSDQPEFKVFFEKYQMDAYYFALRDKVLVKEPKGKLTMMVNCIKECKWFKRYNVKTFVKMSALLLFGQTSFAVIDY